MMRPWIPLLVIAAAIAADHRTIVADPSQARAFKQKYVALIDSWVKSIEFTPAEVAAMRAGKKWEAQMTAGPDDPLAKKILAAGEPSYQAVSSYYPGKILDRTILGSYSDPAKSGEYNDEFAIYWNGAIAANLIKGRLTDRLGETGTQPLAHNTALEFRVGLDEELLGRIRKNYSGVGYEKGFLPIAQAAYERDGVRYSETALAFLPPSESGGWDVAYVRFDIADISSVGRSAELVEHIVLNDGGKMRFENGRLLDGAGATLLTESDPRASFDAPSGRITHKFDLAPGASAQVYLKIPYIPDAKHLLGAASGADFEAVHREVSGFWSGLLANGAVIDVPEPRINDVWRALLLQNFVLADGSRFTYGSGLRYNDSTYPFENGFATHVFAMYGFKDYADQIQAPFLSMSVTPEGAGRKYQNRRAMPLHHLLENYRLSGKTDLFDRFKADYFRVADEIVADRRSTMAETGGAKPLYWGLLPPDKPGVDVQASTQRVYVPGHNITNCQGLADFGRFLVATGIDPQKGEHYMREAADFRRTLMSAMQRAAIRAAGRPLFVDLQTLLFKKTPDYGPDPYDDLALGRLQGTYYHYWVDMEFRYHFFDPEDDVGQWLADYVQQRNGFVLGLTRARNQTGGPYGWINNVYDAGYYDYRLRQGRVDEFLLGLYAKLAFGMSRNLYVASEGSPFIGYNTENGGYVGADYSFPNSAANADTLLMLRDALVLEELKEDVETGKVSLLKGAPRAWLEPGKHFRVERLPTYFGDISFAVESHSKGRITAEIEPPRGNWRTLEISFRHPIREVKVNGTRYTAFDLAGVVRLTPGAARFSVEVLY